MLEFYRSSHRLWWFRARASLAGPGELGCTGAVTLSRWVAASQSPHEVRTPGRPARAYAEALGAEVSIVVSPGPLTLRVA